ncbi:MAG TPA: TIGR03643 family protein [Vampirovibrionales bacterium]
MEIDPITNRIIEMAWADEVAFEDIEFQYEVKEKDVIKLMRKHLKPSSFRLWRKRVTGKLSKHKKLKVTNQN